MSLSGYHQKYLDQPDEEIQNRVTEKDAELQIIFSHVQLATESTIIRVAVLGCGDKRFTPAHKVLFEKYTKKPVELITFDITIEHLQGEEHIFEYDCALPLPNPPYDITFGHVVLRFLETEKQWDLLKNSYDALKEGGMAIHIIDKMDYGTKDTHLPNGLYSVPLTRWKEQLEKEGIEYKELPTKFGIALVLLR